jgi:hypothetical protein
VQSSGRSLSEEIEYRLEGFDNLDQLRAEVQARLTEAQVRLAEAQAYAAAARAELDVKKVLAYRAAGLGILREISGKPTSVIISTAMLGAEAEGLMRAWLGGFTTEQPPTPESRPMTVEETARLDKEIEQIRARVETAKTPSKAEDAA